MRNIRHRNVFKILTACSGVDCHGNDFKALIYEFMVNGSLEKLLHPTPRTDEENEAPGSFNLLQRLDIAIDVACALEYLHKDCQLALPLSLAVMYLNLIVFPVSCLFPCAIFPGWNQKNICNHSSFSS